METQLKAIKQVSVEEYGVVLSDARLKELYGNDVERFDNYGNEMRPVLTEIDAVKKEISKLQAETVDWKDKASHANRLAMLEEYRTGMIDYHREQLNLIASREKHDAEAKALAEAKKELQPLTDKLDELVLLTDEKMQLLTMHGTNAVNGLYLQVLFSLKAKLTVG